VIGCGRIALPVLQAVHDGLLPGWTLAGVLTRRSRTVGATGFACTSSDIESLLAGSPDLILEAAGPKALAAHGARALAAADVWTVSGAALADADLYAKLQAAGRRSGHRLRLVSGALAGLDGVAMTFADPEATLKIDVDLPPAEGECSDLFSGSVREGAAGYPDGVNVAVAAALAGPGLDAARLDVHRPGMRHRLSLQAVSGHADVRASVEIQSGAVLHPVAACLIACLRRETQTIWAG
jgi:aspartate dehydrogenase